jgi:hypothetical protein
VSNQDPPGQQPDPEGSPADPPPTDPYGSSPYGTPPTHTTYGGQPEPPTQPYPVQPPYGQDPSAAAPYGQAPYGQDPYAQPGAYRQPDPYGTYAPPGHGGTPPPHPSATTALVLGLVSLIGLFVCVVPILVAPFAWRTGGRVLREIDAQPGRWSGREQAQAGRIMGMIGTALLVLGVLAAVALTVLLVALAGDTTSVVDTSTPGSPL